MIRFLFVLATVFGNLLPGLAAETAGSPNFRFDFGGREPAGFQGVTPSTLYSPDRGFGFEPGAEVKSFSRGGKNAQVDGFCTSERPFQFSVAVPEGNYAVTVVLGDAQEASRTTIKSELRRLMVEGVEMPAGQFATQTFLVNVRTPRIPGGGEVRLKERERTSEWMNWDEKLTLEFNDRRPAVCSVEIHPAKPAATIFLLGDSTVCDQPREPYASWGQMLPRFFDERVVVANHAESGESLRSSLGSHRLEKVLASMAPGDFLFIQYGHNDMKEKGEGVGAFTTFKTDLKRFVAGARQRGGRPVVITPMHRRTFDAAGKIANSHGDYPAAVRDVAREENVPLIDLQAMSKPFYESLESLGRDQSKRAFAPGDGTHHNNYGSYQLARCVMEGIRTNQLGLEQFFAAAAVAKFDPARPGSPEEFHLPASGSMNAPKPLGN